MIKNFFYIPHDRLTFFANWLFCLFLCLFLPAGFVCDFFDKNQNIHLLTFLTKKHADSTRRLSDVFFCILSLRFCRILFSLRACAFFAIPEEQLGCMPANSTFDVHFLQCTLFRIFGKLSFGLHFLFLLEITEGD